jgi:hypothetical protein
MRSGLGVGPRECVEAVLDADPKQLVPRRVELDLVVAPQPRRILVREPAELERRAAAEAAERGTFSLPTAATLAAQRLNERAIL